MRHLKAFCWLVTFLLGWTLIVLAIPARFLALAGAYLLELLLVGWRSSSLRMLWKPSASVRMDVVATIVQLLLPQRHLGYILSFGLPHRSQQGATASAVVDAAAADLGPAGRLLHRV
jgi:hypothetical protein